MEVLVRRRGRIGHQPLVVEHVRRRDVVEPADAVQGGDAEPLERVAARVELGLGPSGGLCQQPVEGDRARSDQLEGRVEHLAQRAVRPVRREVVVSPIGPELGQVVRAVEWRDAVEPAKQIGHRHPRHDRLQRRMA